MSDFVYSINEIKDIVGDVAQQYGVKKAALFGSYSNGSATPESDIDIIIDKGRIRGLIMLNSFINTLEDRLQKPVDIITYKSLKNSFIKDSVDNEVVLYEQQG
ncbi:MAG: nucleotidyltransferase domain-containing protein [Clostridia bacterium]|nr:nucleotidyltransferase domain-containing protein [Clostridia bacterium]